MLERCSTTLPKEAMVGSSVPASSPSVSLVCNNFAEPRYFLSGHEGLMGFLLVGLLCIVFLKISSERIVHALEDALIKCRA